MRPEIIAFPGGLPVTAFFGSVEQYPYHWHDTLEIIQVLKGSVNISLGDDTLLLRENEVAVVNIGELHRIAKNGGDNEILFIHIEQRFCRSVLPDRKYMFIYCCSTYHEAVVPEKYRLLKEHIARLVRALCAQHEKSVESLASSMLNDLAYDFDFLRWGFGTEPFADPVVNRLRYIAEHTFTDAGEGTWNPETHTFTGAASAA